MERRILIVDDCQVNVEILEELLQNDYRLETAGSGQECLDKFHRFRPHLVLLDVMMRGMDGYETCRRIKAASTGSPVQIILVSGKASMPERLRGYEAGADDYMVKPFDHEEMLAKVNIHFRLREALADLWSANAKVRKFNQELEFLTEEPTSEAVATRDVAIFALARLAESRDPETGGHLERLRNYSMILADQLGREGPYTERIDTQFGEDLYRACPMHDVGKVGIPDAVLLKPGRLTKDEFEIIKRHSAIGSEALQQAVQGGNCASFLAMAIDVARHHHERFDGRGYPDGLAGQQIPLSARIVALADSFDALTSVRVYKPAHDAFVARGMIEEESAEAFDPAVVGAFRTRFQDFVEIIGMGTLPEIEMAAAAACDEVRR